MTTQELAETLTEFEVTHGVISPDKQNEEIPATDRFKQRLDRFGKIAPEAKKISRALRFGTTHEAIDNTAKKRRLDRFGVIPHSSQDDKQRKRQRIDRFNLNSNSSTTTDQETKKKRIDRFGIVKDKSTPVLSDTIKKRTERFGAISQIAKTNTLTEQKLKRTERFKTMTS